LVIANHPYCCRLLPSCARSYVGWYRKQASRRRTANCLVNLRMNKSQQMRMSRRGADLLLQFRCAVYNGTLASGLGRRFQPHANQNERLANAA
jgi:hypothetical protein